MMDEKVLKIIALFHEGKDKHEIAELLGYKDYKGMQAYMKRHGYLWNDEIMNYQNIYGDKEEQKNTNSARNIRPIATQKVASVMAWLSKGMDTREVAKMLKFENHKEMEEYMRSKGYCWNQEERNYGYIGGIQDEEKNPIDDSKTIAEKTYNTNDSMSLAKIKNANNNYVDLLEFLNQNKDRLTEMISEESNNSSVMPRYVLTGLSITKSVHMVNGLDQIIRDFSQEKNISQKEMFQVAMIEFFKKYGYKREIKALIAR